MIRWLGRKLFYTESLKERQDRKLGAIDIDRAKQCNNEDTPILRPPDVDLRVEGLSMGGRVLKNIFPNNNKKNKKRHGSKK